MQTLVSTKYQVVIPKEVRKQLQVKPGQKMDVEVNGEKVILQKAKNQKDWKWPEDYIKNLGGLWKNTKDAKQYLEDERNSWE